MIIWKLHSMEFDAYIVREICASEEIAKKFADSALRNLHHSSVTPWEFSSISGAGVGIRRYVTWGDGSEGWQVVEPIFLEES